MLYKELQAARRKYLPILLIFMLVGLLNTTILNPNVQPTDNSIFHNWLYMLIFLSGGAAILGGSDSIAEESGKNTLSFLLTRPITRNTIYTTKFLVSGISLTIILVLTSLIMFLVEQVPQSYRYRVWDPNLNNFVLNTFELEKVSGREAAICVIIILALGWAMLALTILISIFTRSAIQTIVTVILIALGLTALYVVVDRIYSISYDVGRFFDINRVSGLWDIGLLSVIATVIYFAGLRIFKAKEF